jgi:DNA ligase D-like protein (predicted ligase)
VRQGRHREGGRPASLTRTPAFVEPMAARLVQALPEGDDWLYEVKFDGYRALLIKDGDRVQLRSRKNNDLTATYPAIRDAALRLPVRAVVLDGEIVALSAQGRPSFQALQHRAAHRDYAVVFYAFDLLHLDGDDYMQRPLVDRKDRLRRIVGSSGILLSEALPGSAAQVIDAVGTLGLEGVIAKKKMSPYQPGVRTDGWVKLKLERQQEFVIGGYRPGNHGIDALLVGFYEGKKLHFAGKVRAGFTPHVRRDVYRLLTPLHAKTCPFADLPNARTSHWGGGVTREQMEEMQWVRPRLVAQIRFVEWTADHHLRHAAFLGVRTDKKPGEVRREA